GRTLRERQSESQSIEGRFTEDFTPKNFQEREEREEIASSTHFSRFRVRPSPDGKKDPSTILEAEADARSCVSITFSGLGDHGLSAYAVLWQVSTEDQPVWWRAAP